MSSHLSETVTEVWLLSLSCDLHISSPHVIKTKPRDKKSPAHPQVQLQECVCSVLLLPVSLMFRDNANKAAAFKVGTDTRNRSLVCG